MVGLAGNKLTRALVFIGVSMALWAAGPELDRARELYNRTEFDESLKLLQAIPAKDAPVYALMGRNYFMQGEYKRASESLEKAVAGDPNSAEYALWLARAYGRRAETSSPFTAPSQANKARQNFEKAVQLGPRNLDALNDLFEYYLEAPGFLGGGLDKAQGMVERIRAVSATDGHWAEARLAEKHREFSTAEDQLRRAIETSPRQVGRFIDLAKFLARQGRIQEADQSLARASEMAGDSPKLMYARADLYIRTRRNLPLARELLKRYLACHLTPDDPPRADALRLLRQLQNS